MCALEMFSRTSRDTQATIVKASDLFDSLSQLTTLRCLDISKNRLPHAVCLKLMASLPKLPRLQVLALNQVNLTDDSVDELC